MVSDHDPFESLPGRVFQSEFFLMLECARLLTHDTTVEYAMEAISQAGTVMAVLTKEGVVMVAEKVRCRLPSISLAD